MRAFDHDSMSRARARTRRAWLLDIVAAICAAVFVICMFIIGLALTPGGY